MNRTRWTWAAAPLAAACLALAALAAPAAQASTVTPHSAMLGGPQPATATSLTYTWSSTVYVPFRRSDGTIICTVPLRWQLVSDGTRRRVYEVQVANGNCLLTSATFVEQVSGADIGTGAYWTSGGSNTGFTLGPTTTGQMGWIDNSTAAKIVVKLKRASSSATATYTHAI